ncbi:MAG: hypothetical protein ACTSYA_08235 [Candidatus Kariarchaeaceae archaeon]
MKPKKLTNKAIGMALLLVVILPILSVKSETTIDIGDISMTINIYDAYYCDLQGDGREDDVVAKFTIDIENEEDKYFLFITKIVLELPSGYKYNYYYNMDTSEEEYDYTMNFNNHATESGWYTVDIFCLLFDGRHIGFGLESYTFDPPGDADGGEPPTVELTAN